MPVCRECEDEVDELVRIKFGSRTLRLCEDCADVKREEMEIALTSPSEISSSCKQEIQAALARKSDDSVQFVDAKKKEADATPELAFWENPKYILGSFILACFVGAGLWIYWVEVARKGKRQAMPKGLRKSPKKMMREEKKD